MLASGCDGDSKPATYSTGGAIEGISGSEITLSLNGADSLTLDRNGSFVFEEKLQTGADYNITVSNYPNGILICTVTNGNGTVESNKVDNIMVKCSRHIWSISGDNAVNEGNNARYTLQLSGDTLASGEIATIDVMTADGNGITASSQSDYVSKDEYSFTITGPSASATVQVEILSDSAVEEAENFMIEISEPSRGSILTVSNVVPTTIINTE